MSHHPDAAHRHRDVYRFRLRERTDPVLQSAFAAPVTSEAQGMLVLALDPADDALEAAAEFSLDSDQAEDVIYYGRSLSFDWMRLQLRRLPDGSPKVVSGTAALLEDVHKMLLTPRFRVPIYSTDYGAEFEDLIGLDRPTVEAQVVAMVTETLLVDPRIVGVDVLVHPERIGDGGIHLTITVTDFTGQVLNVPDLLVRYGG